MRGESFATTDSPRSSQSTRRQHRMQSERRSAANVAVVQSTDLRHRTDVAVFGRLDGARLASVFSECQVRTQAVVVTEVP